MANKIHLANMKPIYRIQSINILTAVQWLLSANPVGWLIALIAILAKLIYFISFV